LPASFLNAPSSGSASIDACCAPGSILENRPRPIRRLAMLFHYIRRFFADRRANILPLFGLAIIPMMGLIGAAVDYSRANSVKAALQAALDSTSLAMAAKAPTLTSTELTTQAQAYFDALFIKYNTTRVPLDVVYTNDGSPQVTVSGKTSVNTMFMRIPGFGINSVVVAGSSTSAWGNVRLRVALALDNTGSMDWSGKMPALKTAAKALIDQLKAVAKNDGDVMVSIIPFAKDVNVGTTNSGASWLKWGDWNAVNGWCSDNDYDTKSECESHSKTWTVRSHSNWTGCVKDRDQPHDTNSNAPTTSATRFPAEQYGECPVALMPLSYNWTALKTKIDSMQPRGNTNTTIGLEWGWHSLNQGAPLNAPAEDPKFQYNKVIIFMTDGTNTQNRWHDSDYDGDWKSQEIDSRMKLACTNAKTAGITVYTIHMIDGNAQLLKDCASSSDKYFKITSASQTVSVFTQIGTNLSRLRVAK
jgi:Flp pilus assembly protein TadG